MDGKDVYLIDNTYDGFELFNIDDCAWQAHFDAPEPEQNMPNTVVFAESGNLVVGGSNRDNVYIYQTTTGKRMDTLRHSGWGMVQVVAVSELLTNEKYRC